ncbi:hypothetical protein GUJ93_ZPchr0007g4006 [Zizania palustris]|uniref:Uncharacterized protein n=1 Tax=Zizania palustris TaxID=103762 RepID=A0A8J5T996_ZIZPA|nr:hypothetical protein GUJ93_ZPchr0007g4006 [Zizania palustris]
MGGPPCKIFIPVPRFPRGLRGGRQILRPGSGRRKEEPREKSVKRARCSLESPPARPPAHSQVRLLSLLFRGPTGDELPRVDLRTGTMSLFPGMDLTKMDPPTLTLLGAACCVMLSMHFTVQLVSQHLFYWKNPKEQKAILIIVLMAPLYAINSFVGLLDIKGSKTFFMFLDSVKECYEALAIAKFMALMYSYLNISISKNIVPDEIKGRVLHHSFPVSLFLPRNVRLEHKTLKLLKYWTWQFVVVRPVCSILMISLQLLGFYPSWVSWTFTLILNFSVSMALYALVIFYHLFAKELAPHKPLAKFLCIKGIVFFSFWQGFALEVLAAVGIIQSHHFWLDVEHIQEAIQNVLVILEMVFFSVLQQYAYHVAPYSGADRAKFEKKNE